MTFVYIFSMGSFSLHIMLISYANILG